MAANPDRIGSVVSLWRYPVKSMIGEELDATEVSEQGLVGDRAYALIDTSDGKTATAKNPRKWPNLFDFRATLDGVPSLGERLPPVRIALPDGTILESNQPNVNSILSQAVKRPVQLRCASVSPEAGIAEEYIPDLDDGNRNNRVSEFKLQSGTFFDSAVVHLLTAETISKLLSVYPEGRFEVRRFRPNIVIKTLSGMNDWVENSWVGRILAIGSSVRLYVTSPCGRCVMTTLAQGDLPADLGILRAAVRHNRSHVGVYASVLQTGRLQRGDSVRLE